MFKTRTLWTGIKWQFVFSVDTYKKNLVGDKEVTSLPAMTTEEVFNQPVVIDNVTCPFLLPSLFRLANRFAICCTGHRHLEGRVCWRPNTKMHFQHIVRVALCENKIHS